MSGTDPRFQDLGSRVASGVAMAALAAVALWQGGWWVSGAVALIAGAIAWEQGRMLVAARPLAIGAITLLAVVLADLLPWEMRAPVLLGATGICYLLAEESKKLFVAAHLVAIVGATAFLQIYQGLGLAWLLWLVAVVIVTDVGGYFAGRSIGGPKLWPAVSPKKTWSGTVAGWVGAAIVGLVMMVPLAAGLGIVALSVAVAIAAQAGDIFESAVKRRAGVKDSSALIPGHGGVWDRFDGMLGASLAFWLLRWIF